MNSPKMAPDAPKLIDTAPRTMAGCVNTDTRAAPAVRSIRAGVRGVEVMHCSVTYEEGVGKPASVQAVAQIR